MKINILKMLSRKRPYVLDNEDPNLIIHHPKAMSRTRRRTELSLTVFGWLTWVILCRPALMVFLWIMGFEFFYEHMIQLGGVNALVDFMFVYFGFIFVLYLVIRGWNFYNMARYGKRNKRKKDKIADANDFEAFFHLPAASITEIQQAEHIDVRFLPKHHIQIDVPSPTGQPKSHGGQFKSN